MKPSPWTEALTAAAIAQQDEIPKGFKTCRDIAKELGKSDSHTRRLVHNLLLKNLAEVRYFRVRGDHMLRGTPFYRIK